MRLPEALREACVAARATARDKDDALAAVARLAKNCPLLEGVDEAEILGTLTQRESLGSTGFGGGIAIPHCRLANVPDFVVGLMALPDGVDFDALDGKRVHLIAFIIGPERESSDHIRLLSGISRALKTPDAVREMVAARSVEALRESFLRHAEPQPESPRDEAKRLIHIFIQNEDLFHDVLEVAAAAEDSATVVMEGENAGTYLAKMPLFAGFWQDRPRGFCRVIVAVVDKRLTNEMIRRIESVTGSLGKRDDILVTVQDLAFTAGAVSA